jgi:hypothetical protein
LGTAMFQELNAVQIVEPRGPTKMAHIKHYVIFFGVGEAQVPGKHRVCEYLVEDVEGPLPVLLPTNPGLLEQVVRDVAASHFVLN